MHEDVDDTVIRPRTPVAPVSADFAIGGPVPGGRRPGDDVLGDDADTVIRPRRPLPSVDTPGIDPGAPVAPVPPAVRERVPSVRIEDRVIRLDHPLVIGRAPHHSRVVIGVEPELVAVGSRTGQISSSHLAVRAEGSAVVVEDLRSTNGTTVRPPRGTPVRMPAGAAMVVLTGTLVEIGDGITIEILSPHLRATAPGNRHTRERS